MMGRLLIFGLAVSSFLNYLLAIYHLMIAILWFYTTWYASAYRNITCIRHNMLRFKDASSSVKISGAKYTCPPWFTGCQRKLIAQILDPNPKKRITIPEIYEDVWFQTDYKPSCGYEYNEKIYLDDVSAVFSIIEEHNTEMKTHKSSNFINAFQLIAMSHDLDLSGLFEGQDDERRRTKIGSKHTVNETIKKIEAAAMDMKIHSKQKMTRCCRSSYELSAMVIEVAPRNCVVEISKSAGELTVYKEFCKSLSSLLIEKSDDSKHIEESENVDTNSNSLFLTNECSIEEKDKDNKDQRGYFSS